MIDERPIADREQRQNKWGPLAVGEWLGIILPPICFLVITGLHPGILPFLVFFFLNAAAILGVGRKYQPGTRMDALRYRIDLVRYRSRHFYPRTHDVELRCGDPFLTPVQPSAAGVTILLTTVLMTLLGFIVLVVAILHRHH